jgi:hypothetical protein
MQSTPKFYKNLWGDLQGNLTASFWATTMKAWQEGRFQDSFYSLLDYINPSLRNTYGNPTQTEFLVPHGSVVVSIKVNNGVLDVSCPLVDISSATRIPLLRRVAELNFYPLVLAQIKLASSHQLSFHYSSTLNTSEPFKTYYVLKEICLTADRYDDEFREKFKAKSLVEPKVKYFSPAQTDLAWAQVNEIINETFQFITWCDAQRWFGSSLDFTVIGLKRISFCSQLQGFLKSEIDRIIADITNPQINFNERLQNGRNFLAQIQSAGKESFVKNLYLAEVFVPEKWSMNVEQVKKSIETAVVTINKSYQERNYIGGSIQALYCIYDLFNKNNMDHATNTILVNALSAASGKSWQESSGILLGGLQTIQNLPVQ